MKMDQLTFWRTATPATVRRKIQVGAVCAYISAASTALTAILFSPLFWLDAFLMLALALGTHLRQSRICSVALCLYFLFSKFTQFLAGGGFGGLPAAVLTVAFLSAAVGAFQFQSLWNSYLDAHLWD